MIIIIEIHKEYIKRAMKDLWKRPATAQMA